MTVHSTRFVSAPALPTRLRSWLTTTSVTESRSEVSWAYQHAISPTGVDFETRSGLLQPADCQDVAADPFDHENELPALEAGSSLRCRNMNR